MSVRDEGREREMAIVFRGHRYTLWNQDCTCIAAYEAMRREGKGRREGVVGIWGPQVCYIEYPSQQGGN